MNRSEHLTENQLSAYLGDSALRPETKHEIGRHLLQCDFCLKRLPQPTPEQFWAALMTDEVEDSQNENTNLGARLEYIAEALKQPKIFALSAAALAIVLFFSAFIWLNAAKSFEMEKEVAENFETSQSIEQIIKSDKTENPSAFPIAEADVRFSDTPSRTVSNQELLANKEIKSKQNSKSALQNDSSIRTQSKLPEAEKAIVSSTRGGASAKCSELPPIDSAVEMNDEKVILRWKKIPNAAKYHLYVSDEEEILIDEYETERETTYVLDKPLEKDKVYKWKIVITLADGKTIIGDSQEITTKNYRYKQKKSGQVRNSAIRCSESN